MDSVFVTSIYAKCCANREQALLSESSTPAAQVLLQRPVDNMISQSDIPGKL